MQIPQEEIEECIKAIRQRMHFGMTKEKIVFDLSRFFPHEIIFLAYNAALILEKYK
jgi:hypothetical protein